MQYKGILVKIFYYIFHKEQKTLMNNSSAFIKRSNIMETIKKKELWNQAKLQAIMSKPSGKLSQATHSLLGMSETCKKLKYGPFNEKLIEPASSGNLFFILETLIHFSVGDESDEESHGPSVELVATTIYDESLFVLLVFLFATL